MEFTERELALLMVALDNTAWSIQQSIDDGGGEGHDEHEPVEMQKLWDRVHTQYQDQKLNSGDIQR